MRITKEQLKQLIEEETKTMIDEGWWPFGKKEKEPEPGPEAEPGGDVDERGAPIGVGWQEYDFWGFPGNWSRWMPGDSPRKGEAGEYDKEALQRLWKMGKDPVHGARWKWDNEKEGYVATGYASRAPFGSMWAALVPEHGETAKSAFKRWLRDNRESKRYVAQRAAEREEEERMNPGGDDGNEYEWRGGDMRKRRQKSASLFENKISKKQLNQIIKEEIQKVLDKEQSGPNSSTRE